MLRTVDSIDGYTIHATDGELGSIKEVFFDDERWGIRYLVVETGSWLSSRQVLISPYSITGIDNADQAINVSLTLDQVKNSPDINTHQPISRQLEGAYSQYYGYGNYWTGPYLWGVEGLPAYPAPGAGSAPPAERPEDLIERGTDESQDTHLRSSSKVSGYHILGSDDEIGHVKDFIFDDESWAIRYLLVDTRNWWPGGKKVLLGTQWISRIDWTDSTVQSTLTRDQIKNSPEYDDSLPLDRDYEARLHEHYGKSGYWD